MSPPYITLRDGRRLAYRVFGEADGRPVLYCHGFPSSGAEAAFTDEPARAAGVRVLAPDRPGYGFSDPAPGRSLAGWIDDASALLDALAIEAAPPIGVSGGGPYALACAWSDPKRFPRVATFGALDWLGQARDARGMAGLSRLSIHLARHRRRTHAVLFRLLARLIRIAPETLFRLLSRGHCPADMAAFRDSTTRARWVQALRESVRQGGGAPIQELRLYTGPRPFPLAEVQVPVRLWHGRDDTVVPVRHGERMAAALPHCDARFPAGEGHFSVPIRMLDQAVLEWLVSGISRE